MQPSPQSSTVFPYTTLFRSRDRESSCRGRGRPTARQNPDGVTAGRAKLSSLFRHCRSRQCRNSDDNLDRKSTRLNSSHTVISYAVFCLKKKKGNPTPWTYGV